MAVIDQLSQFIYQEMPQRLVLIQGNIEAVGNPNISLVSKVQNAPLGTHYLQDDVSPKALYIRVGVGTTQDWVQIETSRDIGIDQYNTGLGGVLNGQVVFITSANTVVPADCNNIACSNKVVGIAINTSSQGGICYVKNQGKIVNPLWIGNFVTGDVVYCGNTGEITKTPNMLLSKFIQKIGVFTNDNGELLIDIAESVEIE